MATRKITFQNKIGTTLTDVASVYFRSPDSSFGVRRSDTLALVVAAGTPLTRVSIGIYEYTFTEPSPGLTYNYWLEWEYAGAISRVEQVLSPLVTAPLIAGIVALAPNVFVGMGIQTVSCGDATLATFLNVHANLIWAMQLRRGVALDLRYQYFVLDLIGLALDHVRMLVELETGDGQMTMTGYLNASNVSDASGSSSRTASSSSTLTATATQTSSRSAARTQSSSSTASASQGSTRSMSGSDSSSQTQDTDNDRDATNDSVTTQTPFLHGEHHLFRKSHLESKSDSYVTDDFTRTTHGVPFMGNFTTQDGTKVYSAPFNMSSTELRATDTGDSLTTRRTEVNGITDVFDTATTVGAGSRNNNVTRTATSNMDGSASASSSSHLTSSSHTESHRASASAFHATSAGHATATSTSLMHAESAGASSMVASNVGDHEYFNQIFEALEQMRADTLAQIKRLEAQVMQASRYLISKLPVQTPQSRSIARAALLTDKFLIQRPGGRWGF